MFSFLFKGPTRHATINGDAIVLNAKETVLEGALREGIAFPHCCQVGGCGTCKCRLIEGRITALTDASYVLTEEELDGGYILACQSIPKTDVVIEVDTLAHASPLRTPE